MKRGGGGRRERRRSWRKTDEDILGERGTGRKDDGGLISRDTQDTGVH